MGNGSGAWGAILPLLGLVALSVTAIRRRRAKKKKDEGPDGRT